MRPSVLWITALPALGWLLGVFAVDFHDNFIEDYFYEEDLEVSSSVQVNTIKIGFESSKVLLELDDIDIYEEYMSSPDRQQDVLVFLSSSIEARRVFENAVQTLRSNGIVDDADARFFAAPLIPGQGEPKSTDEFEQSTTRTFEQLHQFASIPEAGLHVIAQFGQKSSNLQVQASNAKLAKPSTTVDEWITKLQTSLESMKQPIVAESTEPPISSMPSMISIGAGAYIILVGIPKLYSNWKFLLELIQSKQLWFLVSMFVMYLSISGTFFTIIHMAPLFYMSGQGFALIHPHSQRQFALEGLFTGMFPFTVSAALLTVSHAMPHLFNPENRFHCVAMCGMVLGISLFLEHAIFISKNRWYRLY